MQITLSQEEIRLSVIDYIKDQGISITGCNVDVQFKAGRLDSGSTAIIDITKDKTVVPSNVPTPRELVLPNAEPAPALKTETVKAKEEPPFEVPAEAAPKKKLFGRMKDKDSA